MKRKVRTTKDVDDYFDLPPSENIFIITRSHIIAFRLLIKKKNHTFTEPVCVFLFRDIKKNKMKTPRREPNDLPLFLDTPSSCISFVYLFSNNFFFDFPLPIYYILGIPTSSSSL